MVFLLIPGLGFMIILAGMFYIYARVHLFLVLNGLVYDNTLFVCWMNVYLVNVVMFSVNWS